MKDIIQSVSPREFALFFWIGVILVTVASYKPTRGALGGILSALFAKPVIGPFALATLYATGEVCLLNWLCFWDIAHLKTTIKWLTTFVFVAMFEISQIKGHKSGIAAITRDIFAFTALFVFITELHSFAWYVEIAALPLIVIIQLMAEFSKRDPQYAQVARLFGCLVPAIGIVYFCYSVWMTVTHWSQTATRGNALDFAIPIMLSVGFLPFLYIFRLITAYQSVFISIKASGIAAQFLPYARFLALTRLRGDLEWLERWRKMLLNDPPATKAQLRQSLDGLFALKKREASPPIVRPESGWSPYLAVKYVADLGYVTSPYHHSFDDEWYASSPMREIGDNLILKNNIAYYVEGTEHAATTLKLKLNVNDPSNPGEAEAIFVEACLHLLEQAISFDARERMANRISTLADFEAQIPFGRVRMSQNIWEGGIKGGYSRKFEVERGMSCR